MPMSERAATALEKSIKHWEENAAAGEDQFYSIHITSESCSLCDEFADSDDCDGCPVSEKTGYGNCEFSPWPKAYWAHRAYLCERGSWKKWREAAKAELEFLKSLREPEGKAS